VVTLPQLREAGDVIGNTILELGARAVNAVLYVPPVSPASAQYLVPSTEEEYCAGDEELLTAKVAKENAKFAKKTATQYIYRYPLQVLGEQILVKTPLVGRHQLRNVALAIAAAVELSQQGFSSITARSIENGIRETRWPGRFQMIPPRPGWPEVVIDVAHNPAGAWALRSALSERYEDRPLIFVFGAMRDKAISEMTEILFPLADRVIATRPENPRAASAEEIQQAAARTGVEVEAVEDVQSAVERARTLAKVGTVIVITGSIYLVGEVMRSVGAEV
jgi:dihydrofolate synthase/folylpolyglutamate synthase